MYININKVIFMASLESKDFKTNNPELDLILIIMYGAPHLYPSDGVPGLHVHAVNRKLYNSLYKDDATEAAQIPEGTMLLHGTISGLFKGKFSTGLTGKDAKAFGRNSIAIASTNVKTKNDINLDKPVVDNEAISIGGVGICAGNDGIGRKIGANEEFAYFQVVNADKPLKLKEQAKFANENDLLKYMQAAAGIGNDLSFVAIIPAKVKTSGINLKTIDGFDSNGHQRENFIEILKEHRQWTCDKNAKEFPDVAHVNTLNYIESIKDAIIVEPQTDIRYNIIDKVMVHDNSLNAQKYEIMPDAVKSSHMQIGDKIYRESRLDKSLSVKLENKANILGVETKALTGTHLMLAWESQIEKAAIEKVKSFRLKWKAKIEEDNYPLNIEKPAIETAKTLTIDWKQRIEDEKKAAGKTRETLKPFKSSWERKIEDKKDNNEYKSTG